MLVPFLNPIGIGCYESILHLYLLTAFFKASLGFGGFINASKNIFASFLEERIELCFLGTGML